MAGADTASNDFVGLGTTNRVKEPTATKKWMPPSVFILRGVDPTESILNCSPGSRLVVELVIMHGLDRRGHRSVPLWHVSPSDTLGLSVAHLMCAQMCTLIMTSSAHAIHERILL